ncbi:MAG: hypothetical protein A7315_06355 [Candidatus Altiarchaeales archaeon WOR_SM1_79]|nr:MAG: hypothetical protein A7315_06355 [Candidatus Altiarchaeales archaeon WOR_SM1_79]
MTPKITSKNNDRNRKNIGFVAYNMGHILYIAQLTGDLEKMDLINSMPKYEQEHYKLAFDSLIEDNILVLQKKDRKKENYVINSKKADYVKELIHVFVRGTKVEKKVREIPRNPFYHRGPIKTTDDFIGRRNIISHIFDRLRHTEDCSIIGPRAIGKTSLLHYISNKDVVKKHHLDTKKYLFVYYDLEGFGESTEVKDFYYEMFAKTVSQIYQEESISEDEIKNINKDSGNTIKKIKRSLFEIADLENLIGSLSERDYSIVYLFDEFDYLANNPTFDYSFYGQLRAFSGNPGYKVAFVTASKRSIYDLTFMEEIKTSPFFRYFEDFRLGLMDRKEIMGFFDMAAKNGVIFSNEMKNAIVKWSGGHPFLAQLASDYFFDLAVEGYDLKLEDAENHLQKFLKTHKKHFAYFWKQVSKKEQSCLLKLAQGKTIGTDCKRILNALEESYLVQRKDGNYVIFSQAFEKFVAELAFSIS